MLKSIVNMKQTVFSIASEENPKTVRKMVMRSHQDSLSGKGRDYTEFFTELENRYKAANV